MWYWIYIFLTCSLIPIILIAVGTMFIHKPPKKINKIIGYRTRMSQKNKETWDFAHKYCGKLWQTIGLWILPIIFAIMLWLKESSEETLSIVGTVICSIELIPLVFSVALTEYALRKHFYNDGTPRKSGDK